MAYGDWAGRAPPPGQLAPAMVVRHNSAGGAASGVAADGRACWSGTSTVVGVGVAVQAHQTITEGGR